MKPIGVAIGVAAVVAVLAIGVAAALAVHHSYPAIAPVTGSIALGMSIALGILRRRLVRRKSAALAHCFVAPDDRRSPAADVLRRGSPLL
jgi:hypothetical protein